MEKYNCIKDGDKTKFVKRLNVIEGQIRGLAGMIESERSYEEVLIQLGALTNSLRSLGTSILENYMQNNLDIKDKKTIEDIINLKDKLV